MTTEEVPGSDETACRNRLSLRHQKAVTFGNIAWRRLEREDVIGKWGLDDMDENVNAEAECSELCDRDMGDRWIKL
jgi:hypothetical protein